MDPSQLALPLHEPLQAVLTDWRRHGLAAARSGRTLTDREGTIRRLADGVDPLVASPEDLVQWLAAQQVAPASLRTYRTHLRAFYRWLAGTGRRLDDPSLQLPSPSVPRAEPRPLTPGDLTRLLQAAADPRAHQTRAYIVLAAYAGLRAHEIAKVRGEDFLAGRLHVVGKGRRAATIPQHPQVAELARRWPAIGWWFPGSDAGHVRRDTVSTAIARAMTRAGISGTPHRCRHFYATEVLRGSGGNLRVTQRAMRHADIRSTAIYTLVTDEEVTAAVHAIPGGRPTLRVVQGGRR